MAQSLVTINVNTKAYGVIIPSDFSGLSFETASLLNSNAGVNGHFFDSSNVQLLMLFKNLGIKNLRIGGASVDDPAVAIPTYEDIDALFRFAKSAGIKIIYSLRLQNGDSQQDAATAKYIWNRYRQYLDYFAIGNEPDYKFQDQDITSYLTFYSKWKKFANAIEDSVPDAKVGGADMSGSTTGWNWGAQFATDQSDSGVVSNVFFHLYVGHGTGSKTPSQLIDEMLSTAWDTYNYPTQYNIIARASDYPYRLTESNSYSTGYPGVQGGNNCFATALFALDYSHWWAVHSSLGINFHTYQWKYNGTVTRDANGNYQINPMGYGIKAFDISSSGKEDSIWIVNPDNLNLTAYAVSDTNSLYVTIINKEHNIGARNATVTIAADETLSNAEVIFLESPNGVTDTIGVTLGESSITNSQVWTGTWLPVDSLDSQTGNYVVIVPASSAAIVRLNNSVTSVRESPKLHGQYKLEQNYPNPFNPATTIGYYIPKSKFISLKIYNILGQEVAVLYEGIQKAGFYKTTFDASKLSSGIYIYCLRSDEFYESMKMLLIK